MNILRRKLVLNQSVSIRENNFFFLGGEFQAKRLLKDRKSYEIFFHLIWNPSSFASNTDLVCNLPGKKIRHERVENVLWIDVEWFRNKFWNGFDWKLGLNSFGLKSRFKPEWIRLIWNNSEWLGSNSFSKFLSRKIRLPDFNRTLFSEDDLDYLRFPRDGICAWDLFLLLNYSPSFLFGQ